MLDGLLFGISAGLALGLSAGLTPGPHMIYMIASTLQYGLRIGLIVAVTPLLAELPIIVIVALGVASGVLPAGLITVIGIIGGALLIYMGYGLSIQNTTQKIENNAQRFKFSKAFLISFLNPNPYIFRMTAGVGLMNHTVEAGGSVRYIVASFFIVFLTINCLITLFAHRIKKYLTSTLYHRVLQCFGYLIIVLGLSMLYTSLGTYL